MILFTRDNCEQCTFIKERVNLDRLGIKTIELSDPLTPEQLSELTFYEVKEAAEKNLPILILEDSTAITEYFEVLEYFLVLSEFLDCGKGCRL